MSITESIGAITDEIIAVSVTFAAIGCAVYTVYMSGEIPDYLSMGFGVVLSYYFTKKVMSNA